jgi:hypothetical protein
MSDSTAEPYCSMQEQLRPPLPLRKRCAALIGTTICILIPVNLGRLPAF